MTSLLQLVCFKYVGSTTIPQLYYLNKEQNSYTVSLSVKDVLYLSSTGGLSFGKDFFSQASAAEL